MYITKGSTMHHQGFNNVSTRVQQCITKGSRGLIRFQQRITECSTVDQQRFNKGPTRNQQKMIKGSSENYQRFNSEYLRMKIISTRIEEAKVSLLKCLVKILSSSS